MQRKAVAILGAGEMGAAVAKRLTDADCSVVVSVAGRSEASRRRLPAFGIAAVETIGEAVAHGDLLLSIVPPGEARRVALTVAAALRSAPRALTYVDCNAVSPQTVREIATIAASELPTSRRPTRSNGLGGAFRYASSMRSALLAGSVRQSMRRGRGQSFPAPCGVRVPHRRHAAAQRDRSPSTA